MQFVQAKNYTRTSGRQIDLAVIHDMEAGESTRTAENVADWFAGDNAPRSSAHYNCDVDSTVQSVRDQDVAWHAPGANHNGIGIENAGYARQTTAEWLDAYSKKMLTEQTAPLVRTLCNRYGLPIQFVDAAGLLRGERGITTHLEVTRAFQRGSHWDPGYHFPMDWFIGQVRGASSAPAPAPRPAAVDDGMLSKGDKGQAVKDWQTILVGAGYATVKVDGDFGGITEAATKDFQTKLRVHADGIVGPATRTAVAQLFAWIKAQEVAKQAAAKPKAPPYPGRPIKIGDKGANVSLIQKRLRDNSGQKIAVDGDFGPATKKAVENVQRYFKLKTDGIVGPNTWGVIWL